MREAKLAPCGGSYIGRPSRRAPRHEAAFLVLTDTVEKLRTPLRLGELLDQLCSEVPKTVGSGANRFSPTPVSGITFQPLYHWMSARPLRLVFQQYRSETVLTDDVREVLLCADWTPLKTPLQQMRGVCLADLIPVCSLSDSEVFAIRRGLDDDLRGF